MFKHAIKNDSITLDSAHPTHSTHPTHHIHWHNRPISSKAFNKIRDWTMKSRSYEPINAKVCKTLTQIKDGATMDQAISIRNTVVKNKIITNYNRMNAKIDQIVEKYKKGENILDLSQQWDFPPLNLLRGIFLALGLPVGNIYNIFNGKEEPSWLLTGRNLAEFRAAVSADADWVINQQSIAEIAAWNEKLVVDFFIDLGIRIKPQEQLVAEQIREYGRAMFTPDILFLDPVNINGARVHWIDFKDYVGTNVGFLYKSNVEQAAKYNNQWGPGAMCYRKSYVENCKIPNCIMLDGRALKLKYK
jgi:hypothetical protein